MNVHTTSGRGWAYTGAVLGGLVSILANVAHSFVPPGDAVDGWSPEPGAVIGAVVWPVFLFVAVEILARVAWPHGLSWHAVRWAGVLPVALVAALVSYRHLSGLLAHYGEEDLVVWLGPLAVDGLMVMATGALLATSRHRTTATDPVPATDRRTDAPTGIPEPTTTPVPTTVLSAVVSDVDTAVSVGVPAVSPPMATTPPPTDTTASTPDTDPKVEEPAVVPAPIPTPADVADRITPNRSASTPTVPATASSTDTRARRPRPNRPTRPAPQLAPSTTDTPVSASDAAQLALPLAPDLLDRATTTARKYLAEHGTPITAGQLATRLRVSSDQAAQALAVIDLDPNNPVPSTATVNGRPVKAPR